MAQLRIRQARYRGIAKTLFQAFMVAPVANLTLLAGADMWLAALAACLIALIWVRKSLMPRSWAGFSRSTPLSVPLGLTAPNRTGLFKMAASRLDF